jgi:predicted pyridoxine 5'-phosphate oxidase superfamily flavin-nucleotide-binding protein
MSRQLPGSQGEHALQAQYGTQARALAFYDNQMLDYLNDAMQAFVGRMEMMWIATADAQGACDVSFRAGPRGFVRVVDAKTLIWPEYRGNGVLASAGNMAENPHVGLLFLDFFHSTVGLHVNGRAVVMDADAVRAEVGLRDLVADALDEVGGRRAERWIRVTVEEAYIHCAKHVPRLAKRPKIRAWGTDDDAAKGGDYFRVKAQKRRFLSSDAHRTSPGRARVGLDVEGRLHSE